MHHSHYYTALTHYICGIIIDMKQKLSVVMITKNANATIELSLNSIQQLANEVLVIDSNSQDNTVMKAQKLATRVINHPEFDLGKQKRFGISQAQNDWILILDSDEVVPLELSKELTLLLEKPKFKAYLIPFQSHLFSQPLHYGGETYSKLIFFNRNYVTIANALVHEQFTAKTAVGKTQNKMLHFSYRSLSQMYSKFTDYAQRDFEQKLRNKEKASIQKLILYPLHMFWARYIKDQGYKDGPARIFLDFGFAYMELLSYAKLLKKQIFK